MRWGRDGGDGRKIAAGEIGGLHLGTAHRGAGKFDGGQIEAIQISAGQICVDEFHVRQRAGTKIRASQIAARKVDAGKGREVGFQSR